MEKIISLFCRNYETDHLVRDQVVSGAEWVLNGEGIATRKFDGTACLIKDGKLYRRHDVKSGRKPPDGFEPAQEKDEVTGHWPGWVPVGDGPSDKHHRRGLKNSTDLPDGTYELCGPKVQGNPEGFAETVLMRHGVEELEDVPRTFDAIREYLSTHAIEGIVWHRPDGRMVKIKARDFGQARAS